MQSLLLALMGEVDLSPVKPAWKGRKRSQITKFAFLAAAAITANAALLPAIAKAQNINVRTPHIYRTAPVIKVPTVHERVLRFNDEAREQIKQATGHRYTRHCAGAVCTAVLQF